MISLFVFLTRISLGITLIFIRTPICLGAWILIFSLFSSVFLRSLYISWFGFTIFLIYIGGILVIFSYFTAIQPNQDIFINKPFFYWLIIYLLLPLNSSSFRIDLFRGAPWWVSCIFNRSNIFCVVILAMVLFLALIRVVKVSITSFSPLRPFS